MDTTTDRHYSRPLDRSLAAYKAWIRRMVAAMGGSGQSTMTEAEWEAAWREFWANENQAKD